MGARRMLRSAAAMVAAVGTKVSSLRSRRPSHATVVAYGALFVALGGTALATTQGFVLGTTNRVNAASAVTNVKADTTQNPITSPLLTLENLTTGTGATALALNVASGKPPFTTNSATRVTNLDADKLDGFDSSAFARFARIVLVRAGGSATANGTALRSALAGISAASSSNPYMIKVEPGVYDLGATPLQMKPNVDIEGSGIDATTLTGAVASNGTA